MTTYYLPRHVHGCEVDDGAVFLDLRKDTYAGIGMRETLAVSPFIEGWDTPKTSRGEASTEYGAQVAAALAGRGLLTREASLGKHAARINVTVTEAVEFRGSLPQDPSIQLSHVIRFLAACASAKFKLRRHTLEKVVADVTARKHRHAAGASMDPREVERLTRIFRRLTPLVYTARNACLFDSLALVEFLSRYGIFPTWFFGVDTRPFQAHSWVQCGSLVLNEELERARQHHPILAV